MQPTLSSLCRAAAQFNQIVSREGPILKGAGVIASVGNPDISTYYTLFMHVLGTVVAIISVMPS